MEAPEADVTHCLQTNRSSSSAVGEGSAPAADEGAPGRRSDAGGAREAEPAPAMPCRRPGGERFLLLERAVSLQGGGGGGGGGGGSREVDALVARLGEVLQLGARPRPTKYRSRDRVAPYSSPQQRLGWLASLQRRPPPRPSLLLLQPPPAPPSSGSPRGSKELCGRGWLQSASRAAAGGKKKQHPLLLEEEDDDDPHRLLQQLILSGNLIKEAVRRLQLAATAAPPAETSTTDSSGSTSSVGSCHSEGDAAAAAAAAAVAGEADTTFAASSLQPLP